MITVYVDTEQQAIDLKQQVLSQGLEFDKDFTFNYKPDLEFSRHYDGHVYTGQFKAEFTFVDPVQETFFRMKFE